MGYFTPDSTVTELEAYMYGVGVIAMSGLYTFTHHAYFFGVMHTGMRMRIAACSLVYRKVRQEGRGSYLLPGLQEGKAGRRG